MPIFTEAQRGYVTCLGSHSKVCIYRVSCFVPLSVFQLSVGEGLGYPT